MTKESIMYQIGQQSFTAEKQANIDRAIEEGHTGRAEYLFSVYLLETINTLGKIAGLPAITLE